MRESQIETTVNKYAKQLGWLCYKFVSPNNRGVPDRIYIKAGTVIMIEFKAAGKKPTKLQAKTIADIKGEQVEVYVIDSVEAGKELFNAITK